MIKVSRWLKEEKITSDVLQDTDVGKVKKVQVLPGQEDGGLNHG